MTADLTPPLKWHGGKQYLASRIVALMPPHLHYVEPFAGGLAVLLAKNPQGVSEVANDLNGWVSNFWNVLRDPDLGAKLIIWLESTPFSQVEFDASMDQMGTSGAPFFHSMGKVNAAGAFFICCRMSLAGRMKDFAPLSRNRTRRKMNEQVSAWLNAIEGLPAVRDRLARVAILNRPAVEVMRAQDGASTLFYLDPPYVPQTRAAPSVYRCEMSLADHAAFLDCAIELKGKAMISGYECELYADRLKNWTRHEFDLPNHAAGGANKRRMREIVWCNF